MRLPHLVMISTVASTALGSIPALGQAPSPAGSTSGQPPAVVIVPAGQDGAADQAVTVPSQPAAPIVVQQPSGPSAPTVVVQPPPYPPYPYPIYVITVPPPPSPPPVAQKPPPSPPRPKPAPAGAHVHDGFYLRMGLGAGALAAAEGNRAGAESIWSTGGAGMEFGMGGAIGSGFMLGGRLLGVGGDSITWQHGNEQTDWPGSLSLSSVQLFADWYLSPGSGFHLQAGLGPSVLSYDPLGGRPRKGDDVTSDLEGFGGAIGVGWEGWVGDEWSIGGVLHLQFASFQGAFDDGAGAGTPGLVGSINEQVDVVAPMLLFTATYN